MLVVLIRCGPSTGSRYQIEEPAAAVPTEIDSRGAIDARYGVSGAQSPDVFLDALTRADGNDGKDGGKG